jgi:uncharacterized protein YjiS (DUF1127 family)
MQASWETGSLLLFGERQMQNIFNYFARQVEDTRRYYNVMNELNRLSDRELSDIGLYRGEIPMVALTALNRK